MTPQEAAKGMRVRYQHGKIIWTICNLKSGRSYGSALLITDDGRYTVEHLSRLVPDDRPTSASSTMKGANS